MDDLKEWLKANVKGCQTAMKEDIRPRGYEKIEEKIDFNNLAMRAAKQFEFPRAPGHEAAMALIQAKLAAWTAEGATEAAEAATKALAEATPALKEATAKAEAKVTAAKKKAAKAVEKVNQVKSGAGTTQVEVQAATEAAARATTLVLKAAEEREKESKKKDVLWQSEHKAMWEAVTATATAKAAQKYAEEMVNAVFIICGYE